jgi:hypothetical protein
MLSARRTDRTLRSVVSILAVLTLLVCGCNETAPTFSSLPDPNALRDRIDAVVDHTLNNRTLSTGTHNAWQIVHGILPYGKAFKIEHDAQLVPALDYLLQGGQLKGWDLRPGEKGVIAQLEPGSKAAQGHPDQWIGYLSQGGLDGLHGLNPEEPLVVGGKQYRVGDLLSQAEWDVMPGMEASWTVMAMSTYRPVDHKWTSRDGSEWTVERLVGMDAGFGVKDGASCGGTHRLSALTLAVNRYMRDTNTPAEKLTGGWKKANDLVEDCIKKARLYQQPDGNFSAEFFVRPGRSSDVNATLHATGHTLEWLCVALNDQELQAPWVTAAVARLCQLLEDNRDRELDCGALYHAARGLRLYRDRRFGAVENNSATIAARPVGEAPKTTSMAAKQDDDAPPPPPGAGQ